MAIGTEHLARSSTWSPRRSACRLEGLEAVPFYEHESGRYAFGLKLAVHDELAHPARRYVEFVCRIGHEDVARHP